MNFSPVQPDKDARSRVNAPPPFSPTHLLKCLCLDIWDDLRAVLRRTAVVALVTAFAISAIMVAAEVWYGNSCVRWGKDTCGDHRIFVTKQHVKKRR